MIVTKNVPSSTAIESGINIKVTQDDCITISCTQYSFLMTNNVQIGTIRKILTSGRPAYEIVEILRLILDIPKKEDTP